MPEELGDVSHIHAPHEIKSMDFNRSHADVQVSGYVTIGHPQHHEAEDFFLALR